MHGVPSDLDLTCFAGATLVRIVRLETQVDFMFEPQACVSVEGQWAVRSPDGQTQGADVLRGLRVTGTQIKAPRSFILEFEENYSLEIFDSSEQYESFSIQPGNIFV